MSHASNTPRTFSGARNEESALFSMTSALVANISGSAAALSDSSGYLDVAQLSQKPLARPRSAAAAASTLIGAPAPTGELAGTQTKSFAHAVIGVLALGLASLTAHLSWNQMPQQPPPAATMPAIVAAPDTDVDYDTRAVPESPAPAQDLTEDDDTEIVDEEVTTRAKRPTKSKSKSKSKSRSKSKAKAKTTPQPKAATPAPSKPSKSSKPDVMSVDCLLNPDSCREPEKPKAKPSKPAAEELPKKLTLAQLKQGTAASKAAALRQCSALASPGTKLQVKLSIAGATGAVVKSTALGSAAGTQLGKCVTRELATSKFSKVAAIQQGTVITLRF
ncbi:MAG: hypothetical protein ACPG4T_20050 [Nannocystaceae bacterium]